MASTGTTDTSARSPDATTSGEARQTRGPTQLNPRAAAAAATAGYRDAPRPERVVCGMHHYLPGMNLAFAAGGTALIARAGKLEQWLSLPFGVGVALTVDEAGILISRNDPYWGGTHAAQNEVAASSLATLGIAFDFLRRGRAHAA